MSVRLSVRVSMPACLPVMIRNCDKMVKSKVNHLTAHNSELNNVVKFRWYFPANGGVKYRYGIEI